MSVFALHGLVFAVVLMGLAGAALGASEIRDGSGKVVLTVEGDTVKREGKTVMTIDGDKISDASGKMVIYVNGDMIRNEPNGKLLLMIDGRHLRREIGGSRCCIWMGRT